MRSSSAKADKKAVKSAVTRPYAIKRKLVDLKQPVRDTISETISFVIKGKLTPIKPILIDDKFDVLSKPSRKAQVSGRISKKRKAKAEQRCDKQQPARNAKQKAKAKSKAQSETAKKASAQHSSKKLAEAKPLVKTKYKKVGKTEETSNVTKSNAKKPPRKSKKKVEAVPEAKKPQEKLPESDKSSEIKKQQTIDELLKQVNEEIRETKKSYKLKKQKTKLKKDAVEAKKSKETDNTKKVTETKSPSPVPESSPKKSSLNVVVEELEPATIKTEKTDPSASEIPDELPLNKLTEISPPVIKNEPISDKEEQPEVKPVRKSYKKIKTTPKMTIMKKRVITKRSDDDDDKDKRYKTKLFGFWNGPKRHRVASLNALAKVHCLYENESRANVLDNFDDATKLEYSPKKETSKKSDIKKEVESSDESVSSPPSSPIPTRTLRTGPGLRGAGKHWDMLSSFSSSDDVSDVDELPVKSVKKEKPARPAKAEKPPEKSKSERKRCRKQSELVMDLKDMVVRKRMASLNASAILAASYSVERRHQGKSIKSDDSDSYDGSSEEYFAASDTEIKLEEDVKKEEDRKLIEVHTTPNKKVAVILNQDTDVTITGVYVNSTTRSTHHEGFCSIAGMQYRISATSHTQTAATAVSTETLLQSSSGSAPDSNSDSMPSSKSYTPLDALSNMQPPPGPGIQHNHPVVHGQQHLAPPAPHQHVLPIPPHQLSPGLRHSCSSAFSSPHSTPTYQIPHHPPLQGEQGFVHAGYYQPAGPLITVPTGHGQPPPPTSLSTKSVPLSETSPSSTTPSVTGHDPPTTQVPPLNSNGGDSSDSDVIITSVTTAKDHHHAAPAAPPAHHQPAYRYSQYPPTPPGYSYTHYPPYPYSTPPPTPSYAHHELCYSYKYPPPTSYRRYLTGGYYPTTAAVQELYPPPTGGGQGQQTQQVVTAAPPVSAPGSVAPFPPSAGGPPPPTLIETYPAPPPPPQATLIETYPPPSTHYYPPQAAYGPAPPPPPSCYTHPQQRAIPFINATYQSCPCPMQSCPKNVHTGPLTGDSKRSNMTSISKDSMPLPPVALALPLEPVSATGPPSPARGSAGMPPPPSPAGATYHQPPPSVPPPPTTTAKQEPNIREECKKRKARVGKAMVRNSMQQNTMLLMCNPTQNIVGTVKREIESPKEKAEVQEVQEKKEILEEVKPTPKEIVPQAALFAQTEELTKEPAEEPTEATPSPPILEAEEKTPQPETPTEESLPPVVSTVAENVKMKNMKRKLSVTNEKTPEPETVAPKKKQKLSSYKCLIKKNTTTIKINNGRRKLIEETLARNRRSTTKSKKSATKRKLIVITETTSKRPKMTKPLSDSNCHNSKQASKSKAEVAKAPKKPTKKQQQQTVNSKSSKTAPSALDTLISKNNMERTIDSVVRENRTSKESALKAVSKCGKSEKDEATVASSKKSTNNKNGQKVSKSECKKAASGRRKSKTADVVTEAVTQVPRKLAHLPKWSNGWRWEGEPYEAKVFINSDEMTVVRKCYPAMLHETGDKIVIRDCVLLKAGPRKNDLPFVAKIAALWENPEDGEMMMSLLWYYRPEHTEQGRLPTDQADEVFASRHKDSNSVACIDDKCYVLTFNEYCRYRKRFKRIEEGIEEMLPCIPNPEPYPRSHRQPPTSQISPEMVFFCRRVYDFRQKRIMKNPT